MNINQYNVEPPFRLKLQGSMTFERRHELEGTIIDAMRRHKVLEADLSEVRDIDFYGIHLLALLHSVGEVVAVSSAVEDAASQLPLIKIMNRRELARSSYGKV